MTKKLILSLCLALTLVGTAACGGGDGEKKSSAETKKASASEPDLTGIPAVVAEVNGEKILKAEFVQTYEAQFQQQAAQAQASGQAPDQDQLKEQTLEGMVGAALLLQESDSRGLKASEKDVDAEVDEMVKQNNLGSAKEFFAAVEKQGTDEKVARAQIADQVKVDQLIAEEGGDIDPSKKEVKKAYEQTVAQQEQAGAAGGQAQGVPPLKEIRSQIEDQLMSQKESETAQSLIADFRKKADVKVNL